MITNRPHASAQERITDTAPAVKSYAKPGPGLGQSVPVLDQVSGR